jgi:hypothetical protein
MPRGRLAEDLIGRRFGRYVVLSRTENRNRRAFWLCRCDCGVEKEVSGQHLRLARVVSCGCLNRELVTATLVASNYKGDEVTYYAAHDRVKVARGAACGHSCIDCGERAQDWSLRRDADKLTFGHAGRYTLAFSPDPQDYVPRCKPCHGKYDSDWRRDRRTAAAGRVDDPETVHPAAG